MYKIILVEDDELIGTMIKFNLEKEGFEVVCYRDAETGLHNILSDKSDLILLDIMLPGMSGYELLKELRDRKVMTPVIMVTAKSDMDTKLESFGKGADDYIAKPFNMQELKARIEAVIRRSQGERSIHSAQIMQIAEYTVDLDKHQAVTKEGTILLSEKECNLLKYFYKNPGKTLPRADILEEVWGMDAYPTPRTIDNFVVKFRKLFEENPEQPKHFITVRSKGYQFLP